MLKGYLQQKTRACLTQEQRFSVCKVWLRFYRNKMTPRQRPWLSQNLSAALRSIAECYVTDSNTELACPVAPTRITTCFRFDRAEFWYVSSGHFFLFEPGVYKLDELYRGRRQIMNLDPRGVQAE